MIKEKFSPFLEFSRETWRQFRQGMTMPLDKKDVDRLGGQMEKISSNEVEEIYLSLSLLIKIHFSKNKSIRRELTSFLGVQTLSPFIIGIAGSVAVGKSTTSRILQALLSHWPENPRVDIVTTDSFLYSNEKLESLKISDRKGFPESYHLRHLIQFLSEIKSGKRHLKVPVYSHRIYDIVPHEFQTVDQPDIIILEGLNVLQIGSSSSKRTPKIYVSDFFDFSIYVDAPKEVIKGWFLERFKLFRDNARHDSTAFFHPFTRWSDEKALTFAEEVWTDINERNLQDNILPYKSRADLILVKDEQHSVEKIFLKKM